MNVTNNVFKFKIKNIISHLGRSNRQKLKEARGGWWRFVVRSTRNTDCNFLHLRTIYIERLLICFLTLFQVSAGSSVLIIWNFTRSFVRRNNIPAASSKNMHYLVLSRSPCVCFQVHTNKRNMVLPFCSLFFLSPSSYLWIRTISVNLIFILWFDISTSCLVDFLSLMFLSKNVYYVAR